MTKHPLFYRAALALLLALALLAPSTGRAAPTGKIGFVNIDEVSAKASLIKNMLGSIEASASEKQKSIEARQAEYDRLSKDLKSKAAVASESELQDLRKQAREALNQVDEETYQLNQFLQRAEKEKMDPATDRVLEAIKAVGAEEGFDLVVRGETILYGSAAVDLTEKVIERLNRGSVSGDSAVPAAAEKTEKSESDSGSAASSVEAEPTKAPEKKSAPATPAPKTRSTTKKAR